MEHKAWHHFLTITQHKLLVMQNCFRVGLFKQGLLHDLSKYSPAEFLTGVHYYQGDRSPNAAEREEKGYSSAWLHHKSGHCRSKDAGQLPGGDGYGPHCGL